MSSLTSSRAALALAFAIAASAGAACGGSVVTPPEVPPPAPSETVATPAPALPPSAAPTTAPAATPPPSAGPAGTPVQATAMLADLKKLGIDPAKMPVLEKMSLADKKKVMPFFVKALGYAGNKDCTGCHASLSDYATVTHNMELTRGMWDHFVAYGRDTNDGLMFCDSCHAGKDRILNRADKEGVKAFMKSDYVGKIHRADKKPMDCKTCHGDPFQADIFGQVWHVK